MDELIGIDEAGRGALAGPMVLAACRLYKNIEALNDSKKLSPKKRQSLREQILKNSSYLILYFSNDQIDKIGLSSCFSLGLETIKRHFKGSFLFDGNCSYKVANIKTIVKADSKYPQVMAASILAKTSRDAFMMAIRSDYDFSSHKGYGTKAHLEEIKRLGKASYHRKSFVIKG